MTQLHSQLTVVITTSPAPSNPSTDLISSILLSFRRHCAGLLDTRVIVVFDTFDRIGSEARLKKGQATPEIANSYNLYKDNVKELILREYASSDAEPIFTEHHDSAEFGSEAYSWNCVDLAITQTDNKHVTFIEPAGRLGFGLAVRSALRIVETPYVWVQQHDWAIIADIPLEPLLEIMQASESNETEAVKYVSFTSIRMLAYAVSPPVTAHPALKALTASIQRNFAPPSQPEAKIPLTPLFFWFDKPHIASTAHYLSCVFPSRLAIRRGEFIEDTVGQRARGQMKEGLWHKWACWLYYPDEGKQLCLRHLMGRTWKGFDAKMKYNSSTNCKEISSEITSDS